MSDQADRADEIESASVKPAQIDTRFLVERQGRWFVTYQGLLDYAHQLGISNITTTIIELPSPENGGRAVCFASVTVEKGTFTGVGDAAPDNVSRIMVPAIIRMAETRAKARALRDAVNIGVAALEEMGDVQEQAAKPEYRPTRRPDDYAPASEQKPPVQTRDYPPPQSSPASDGTNATPNQIRAIFSIGRNKGLDEQGLENRAQALYGSSVGKLSKRQASDFIQGLQNGTIE